MSEWYYSKGGGRLGPYSDDDMRRFAAAGEFDADSLFWNPTFGQTWKRLTETPFVSAPGTSTTPKPPVSRGKKVLGMVAGVTLLVVGGLRLLLVLGNTTRPATIPACNSSQASAEVLRVSSDVETVKLLGLTVQSLADQREVSAAERTRSCRGTVVLSDHSQHVVSYSFEIDSNQSNFHTRVNITILPACQSTRAQRQVVPIANSLERLKSAGVTVTNLDGQQEVSSTDALRSCKAVALLSDQSRQPFTYTFATRPEEKMYTEVNLEVIPFCNSSVVPIEVLRVANTLERLKSASLTAVSLGDVQQVRLADKLRSCKGMIVLSDGSRHAATYSIEDRPEVYSFRVDVQ